jgi:hypothetical protein
VNTNLSNNDNVTIQSTTTEGMCFANYDNESEVKVTCSNNNDNVDNESEVEVTYTNNNDNVDGGLCCFSPSEKYEFPHKSTAEAMVILRTYGTLKDVHGDGSCGYHSIMLLLQKLKLIDNNLSVTAFRRGIHDFILSNMNKFVGDSEVGNDCVYQFPWGSMQRAIKLSRNPAASRKRFMTTHVLSGIWSKNVNYSSYVSRPHWMDASYLLTVIAYKYQTEQLVLYDISGTNMVGEDGSRCFKTCRDNNGMGVSCLIEEIVQIRLPLSC